MQEAAARRWTGRKGMRCSPPEREEETRRDTIPLGEGCKGFRVRAGTSKGGMLSLI
jgi:hypothetical protein